MFVVVLKFDVWSLGLSYSVASFTSILLLLFLLNKKVNGFPRDLLFNPAFKMTFAAFIAAVALYLPIKALDQLVFDTTRTVNLIMLTGIASFIGISIYILLVWQMKVRELYIFGNLLKKFYHLQFKVKTDEIVKETGTV